MTATPIPRSLTMTLYGGMDLSIIDALPPGRKPVKTRMIPENKVDDCYRYVKEQAAAGCQTYIVCPLVEASEARQEATAVEDHFEALSAGPLAGVRTALIHGRLDGGEKDGIMARFSAGDIDVLFSTTVIEVGIDVPRAAIMVIENADQFGLTQLHQLRGRVGRGERQAYCFLLGKPATPEGRERLRIFCETESGFDLAEADLALRGPGEVGGFRQSGFDDAHTMAWIQDGRLLHRARTRAEEILASDPELADRAWDGLRPSIMAYSDLAY
jgi:ATP-dependent DNA helicase RecG